jgi:hypothetical protein
MGKVVVDLKDEVKLLGNEYDFPFGRIQSFIYM